MKKLLLLVCLPLTCFAEFSDLHIKEVEYVIGRWIKPALNRTSDEKRKQATLLCKYINNEASDKGELLELIQSIKSDHSMMNRLTPTEQHWFSSKVLVALAEEQYFKITNFDQEYLDGLLKSTEQEKRNLGIHLLSTQRSSLQSKRMLEKIIREKKFGALNQYVKMIVTQVIEDSDSESSGTLVGKLFSSKDECSKLFYALMFHIKKAEFYGFKESDLTRDILNSCARRLSLDSDVTGAFVDLFDQRSIEEKRKYLVGELERLDKIEKGVETESENKTKQGNKQMSTTLVMRRMPEFEMEAYDSATGYYTKVSSEQFKGKWVVVCFYPADFTFVCPTEIAAMNANLDKLNELGVAVVPISADTKFSHKRFVETEPLLKGLKLTMGSDPTGNIARKFGVWVEQEGAALRGRFIINPDGIVVAEETVADSVGRSVGELIRQLEAWQHAYKTGEVCPAGWRKGKKTLPVNTDVEKMTGRVGDYITLEEILS